MELFYTTLIIVIFILAIADLIVGVSNDAVNFLNSAIGSKAIPMKTILVVAGLGVLIGAVFSSGLMEVARKGIFTPELFYFDEIIIIFLAVLITDILLLDFFNSIGIPTSTTVSVVFELLGASICLALLKMYYEPGQSMALNDYINVSKSSDISLAILSSVFIAFIVGAIIQYACRLIFTFDYQEKPLWLKILFGGISLSAITYFILIKGINTIQFIGDDFTGYVKSNSISIILISLFSWTFISWIVHSIFKINIFKLIIVLGTFALALAFAGNDLVNFIGVSIAAWQSFEIWLEAYQINGILPSDFKMTALSGEVRTPEYMLIIAGVIMVFTLWFSRKAQYVVQTGVNLSRQGEGEERFKSTALAQKLVRSFYYLGIGLKQITPNPVINFSNHRFYKRNDEVNQGITRPAFDMLRASVNLVLASILISIATNFTLPLSTTYITFMVAMGSSFGDKAWGRENAVYRVTGVLNVLGSWILTALIALLSTALIVGILYFGEAYAIVFLLVFVVYSIVRNYYKHSKLIKSQKQKKRFKRSDIITINDITTESSQNIISIINGINSRYNDLSNGLGYHDLARLNKLLKELPELEDQIESLKDNIFYYIKSLADDTVEASKFYILTLDYLQQMVQSLSYMLRSSHKYVSNNHRNLKFNQIRELKSINRELNVIFDHITIVFEKNEFDDIEILIQQKKELLETVSDSVEKQIERIRTTDMGQQNTKFYFGLLLETKDLISEGVSLLNLFNDYYLEAIEEF